MRRGKDRGMSSVGTSKDGEESSSIQDEEEDVHLIMEMLSTVKSPQVKQKFNAVQFGNYYSVVMHMVKKGGTLIHSLSSSIFSMWQHTTVYFNISQNPKQCTIIKLCVCMHLSVCWHAHACA